MLRHYFLKHKTVGYILLDQVVTTLFSFLLVVVLARVISETDFGYFRYGISLLGIFNIFSLVGIAAALIRAVSLGHDKTVFFAIRSKMTYGIIGSVVASCIALFYFLTGDIRLCFIFLLLVFSTPFFDAVNTHIWFLNGQKKYKQIFVYNSLAYAGSFFFVLSIVLVYPNYFAALFAYIFGMISVRFYFLKHTINKHTFVGESDDSILPYGKKYALSNFFDILGTHFDKVIVFHMFGPVATALYTFVVLFIDQVRDFGRSVGNIMIAEFSKKKDARDEYLVALKVSALVMFAVFCIAGVLYFVLPVLYTLLFKEYIEAIKYIPLYIASVVVAPTYVLLAWFQGKGEVQDINKLISFQTILHLSLIVVCGYIFGFVGVFIGASLARVMYTLFFFIFFRKRVLEYKA